MTTLCTRPALGMLGFGFVPKRSDEDAENPQRRSKDATNGAPGLTTSNKEAMNGAPGIATNGARTQHKPGCVAMDPKNPGTPP